MEADAFDIQLADFFRPVGRGDVEHGHACGPDPLPFFRSDRLADGFRIIGLFIGERFDIGEEVERVDDQQQVVMCLEMNIPGVGRGLHVVDDDRVLRIPHVDDRKPSRPRMRHIGITAMDHQLQPVTPPADIAVADEFHVAGEIGCGKVGGGHVYSSLQMESAASRWRRILVKAISA
ncbi:hypothetical protein D3C87_1178980 [compost metagenome]